MSSVPRAAMVGGILAVVLHLLLRVVFRNLHWIALVAGALFVLDRGAPDYDQISSKRAIRDSFDVSKVTLTAIIGRPESDGFVKEIAVTVRNGGNARVYDLRTICSYSARHEPERYWTATDYHYGYIGPHSAAEIVLRLKSGIYLDRADPSSFECKPPSFEVEKSDLFRTGQ